MRTSNFFYSKGNLTTSLNKTVSTVSFRGNLRSSVIYYLISLCQKSLLSTLIFTKANTFGLLSLFNWAPLLGSWAVWISTLVFSLHILKLSTSEGNVHCCIHIQNTLRIKKEEEGAVLFLFSSVSLCFCYMGFVSLIWLSGSEFLDSLREQVSLLNFDFGFYVLIMNLCCVCLFNLVMRFSFRVLICCGS